LTIENVKQLNFNHSLKGERIMGTSCKKAAIFLIVVCMFVFIGSVVFAEQECRLIQISGEVQGAGSQIVISPKTLTVPVGTCTVWISFIKAIDQLTVSFRENAKACVASTEASKDFGLMDLKEGESCYLSRPLALGQSSSLIWTKPGEYKYTIQFASKVPNSQIIEPVKAEGTIIVK
jgi:hypothetical protein